MMIQTVLLANTFIIKGTVTDNNQQPVANKVVRIYTDSTGQSCYVSHTRITNPNGFYIDTLTCNGDIRHILVDVEDCTGKHIINQPPFASNSNIIESNFSICNSTPGTSTSCKSVFSMISNTAGLAPIIGAPIYFSSGESAAPTGDSIISRTWYFGDSSAPITGNTVNISHSYSKAGTYQVYLLIKTARGCEGKYTLSVTIANPNTTCQLQISLTTEKVSARSIRFNSSLSKTGAGDSILSRSWKFSDGSVLEGNEISPLKVFKDTGTYTACLTMKTKTGCTRDNCVQVVIKDTVPVAPIPTSCKAVFSDTIQGFTVNFNSSASLATAGLVTDSIISRTWYITDSTINAPIEGNSIRLSHTFSKPGTYQVYLVIKTKNGCTSKYGAPVTITAPTTACNLQVKLTVEKFGPHKFQFSSAQSTTNLGDTIKLRSWKFGDGSVQSGTEMTLTKEFKDTGLYTVCVSLTSKAGCTKETCVQVLVKDSITTPSTIPTGCKAQFNYTIQGNTVSLNSSSSLAGTLGDSIIKRTWYFTDSTANAPLTGNLINTTHSFSKAGTYTIYLVINTQKGCESKYSATVVIANTTFHCEAQASFNTENVSLKQIRFSSNSSKAQAGDSIIQRNWNFGDSTSLQGNEISPLKEYAKIGFYQACLQIKTAKGCEAKICNEVTIRDTTTTPQSSIDYVKIISINPNPVITKMMLTVWNRNNNVETEISIYDIYGNAKLTLKKLLAEGNNIIEIATDQLYHGPYFLRISTKNGKDSRQFYKL